MAKKSTDQILKELDLLKEYLAQRVDHNTKVISDRLNHLWVYRHTGMLFIDRSNNANFPSFNHWKFSQQHHYQFSTPY